MTCLRISAIPIITEFSENDYKKCLIKAVKIYVEFYSFLCIIKVAEIV